MPKAIRFYQPGGPEVLVWEEVPIGKPGPGEARVRHTTVGLNYVDIYIRRGLYPVPLPSGLGTEAAGVVEEVGSDVTEVKPGDRVAYAGGPLGAYCEERVMPADRLVVPPQGISDQQAAAMMLKGLTVAGDEKRGEQVLNQCKPCHSLDAGKNGVGPTLHGLFGRKAGTVPDYNYSAAMKNSKVVWNEDTLKQYLADPHKFIPGEKMIFAGIKNEEQLNDLIVYLREATQ
jgi:cytochrome c2